jgi:iron complex transport system substrate-binding protein
LSVQRLKSLIHRKEGVRRSLTSATLVALLFTCIARPREIGFRSEQASNRLLLPARPLTTVVCFFFCLLLQACTSAVSNDPTPAVVSKLVASQGQATVRYAKCFTLEYKNGYKLITVKTPWKEAKEGFSYVLVPRGAPAPSLAEGQILVRTPVRRVAITSTTYVPYFTMLGLEDKLVGVAKGELIMTPSLAKRYTEGKIAEIGNRSDGMGHDLNMELVLGLQPDLIMLYGTGNSVFDSHEQLRAVNLPFAIDAEYMETTPLGVAEWIKFAAAFFDKDAEAERIFNEIASRYEALAAQVRQVSTRPTVFSGGDYHGVWYGPGGKSYRARILADAGADYLWKDNTSQGSIPFSMEAVMLAAKHADFWIDVGTSRSLSQLAGGDERYRTLQAFQEKRVYNNDALINAAGGNDFWESGMVHPDQMLADLISIFHPELLPGYKRIWYRQLPDRSGS